LDRRGKPLVGVGVETVSIDAGAAGGFDPPFPAHYYLMGANKYGVTQLANLGALPPTGMLLFVAPLKLTGSPVRALALVSQR
jgi:kynurenine formamidase